MTPYEFLVNAINPALSWLPPKMRSENARVQMIATALQESQLIHRRQMGNGPARSFYQMERGGMVSGVMMQPSATIGGLARSACDWRGVAFDPMSVWNAIENDDVLASVFARLGMWADPAPIPPTGASEAAWQFYLQTWRPGKPRPETWAANYKQALSTLEL